MMMSPRRGGAARRTETYNWGTSCTLCCDCICGNNLLGKGVASGMFIVRL